MDVVALGLAKADAARRYAHAGAASSKLRPVTLRANHLGNSTYLQAAGQTSSTYKAQHPLIVGVTATGIRVLYGNVTGGSTQPNPVTISADLEINGRTYAVTWGGQTTVTIQPKQTVLSDIVVGLDLDPVQTIQPAAAIYSRTYVSVADNTKRWPVGLSSVAANAEGSTIGAPGTDLTGKGFDLAPGTVTAVNSAGMFTPAAIVGLPSPRTLPAVCIVGDSISIGTGDLSSSYGTFDTILDFGLFLRALNRQIPHVWIAKHGDTAQNLSSSRLWRSAALDYATHAICQMGCNDVQGNATAPNLQSYLLSLWRMCAARGVPVWQTTITPVSTSSDFWLATVNQTSHANEAARVTVNDWIRDGAPITKGTLTPVATGTAAGSTVDRAGSATHPLTGYFEVADTVETARNSGKWKAHARARTVTDAAMTSGTQVLTSASAAFTSADVGRFVAVTGVGGSGTTVTAKINSITSATQVVISQSASTTASGQTAALGGFTVDGIHPTPDGHAAAALAIDITKFVVP